MTPPEGRANTADILVIGAQRAMTTWAHQVLSAHPGTWAFPDCAPLTSTNKEAQFWTRNRHRGPDWYRVLMTPPERRERLSLDFTPHYAPLPEAQIAECKALSPMARVIYILRDPLARAVSALRMHAMWDRGKPAPEALRLDLGPETEGRIQRAALWDHAAYAANARRWRRHYPDLIVLNHEDLAADPQGGARRLLALCGLEAEELDPGPAEALAARAGARVWAAPAYPLSPDLLHWLHGATWQERRRAEEEFGFIFNEYQAVLATASEDAA